MTDFNEIRLGKAGTPQDPTARPSQDNVIQGVTAYPPRQGVPIGVGYYQSFVPLAVGTANIAALQTPSSAGNLTLAAATGTTLVTLTVGGVNYTCIALDVPRCVSITGASGAVAVTATIKGFDRYDQPMTQTITTPTGVSTVNTTKAFAYVTSIAVSGGTTGAISVGTSDIFGFDLCVPYFEALVSLMWNGSEVTANTNFTAAIATAPSTAALGDVRGTFNAGAIAASNGTIRFAYSAVYANGTDTVTQAWGQPQV